MRKHFSKALRKSEMKILISEVLLNFDVIASGKTKQRMIHCIAYANDILTKMLCNT